MNNPDSSTHGNGALIKVTNLSKVYDNGIELIQVLHDVNLRVNPGEIAEAFKLAASIAVDVVTVGNVPEVTVAVAGAIVRQDRIADSGNGFDHKTVDSTPAAFGGVVCNRDVAQSDWPAGRKDAAPRTSVIAGNRCVVADFDCPVTRPTDVVDAAT